ncbi:PRC-barrel domain-containing protein [Sphingomonas sp. S1-29]|uniref:PRC-barrel domain-containing protein n=1 Tax=Sphingomonas sp. S1-29 TaxID=2991074 RepID=UPI00223F298A|nr:PRC-barrel domain-containing protein [Sphingomonas sp. S1-29]UZK68820.1 PRC-barrel domain-containing protein [Sphingomonas sp. S1-29]
MEITLHEVAGWIAPIATMIAALMTAANLGSRITGWGFVVFTVGSIAWSTVAIGTGQTNLLLTNGFLTFVNAVGIWRWLGRQARHEDGSKAAKARSAAARVPDLFGIGSLVGGTLIGRDGTAIGTVIDGMMRCDGAGLAYIVVGEGGLGGVGERLHALHPNRLRFGDGIACDLDGTELSQLPVLANDDWPTTLDDNTAYN